MIGWDDKKAIRMAIELLVMSRLNTLTAMDIEDTLGMDFDNYPNGAASVQEVIREFRLEKGI